jgi:hypothetical protein
LRGILARSKLAPCGRGCTEPLLLGDLPFQLGHQDQQFLPAQFSPPLFLFFQGYAVQHGFGYLEGLTNLCILPEACTLFFCLRLCPKSATCWLLPGPTLGPTGVYWSSKHSGESSAMGLSTPFSSLPSPALSPWASLQGRLCAR